MKTIKCDRCGKDIPYVPPYMNVAQQGVIRPKIIMTIWDAQNQRTSEVDLCGKCQLAVYDYIFEYNSKDYNERIIRCD